jgi:hypothetical protein
MHTLRKLHTWHKRGTQAVTLSGTASAGSSRAGLLSDTSLTPPGFQKDLPNKAAPSVNNDDPKKTIDVEVNDSRCCCKAFCVLQFSHGGY